MSPEDFIRKNIIQKLQELDYQGGGIEGDERWYASPVHLIGNYADASTPREAICRSVVMIEFDDVVDIPDELLVKS